MNTNPHDMYAADYDNQVQAYDCHIAEILFGLCYEFTQPHQSLLDIGIGSGLSAALFAKAGLEVHGMDFSPAMLEICRAKGIAVDLKQHDLQQVPWQYPTAQFDHIICCGVLHFIPDLEAIFGEAGRVLHAGGVFAFTVKVSSSATFDNPKYEKQLTGGFEIFSHLPQYVQSLLEGQSFKRMKTQKCFIGEDLFDIWLVRKN
jgi:predicted TPR repeat methyltransferase